MKKYVVTFEHTRKYRVYVSAANYTDAKSKAIKTVWKNGIPMDKYMIDDDAVAKSAKCLDS